MVPAFFYFEKQELWDKQNKQKLMRKTVLTK